jgi:hypothetical protein
VYADGKIYFCGKKGVVSVIAAAREFQLLAENRLEASFIASPAVAGQSIILRSLTHLYCIAKGYEMAPQPEVSSKPKPDRARGGDTGKGRGAMYREALEKFDKDPDGKLSEEERQAAKKAWPKRRGQSG